MKSLATLLLAGLLGMAASFIAGRSVAFRDSLGQLLGHGHLVAIAESGEGIYEDRLFDDEGVGDAVTRANLRQRSRHEVTDLADTRRELDLLRAQFGSEKLFDEALRRSGLSAAQLHGLVTEGVRAEHWLKRQLPVEPTEQECREFYAAHPERFAQPVRFHAAHIFLAAPDGSFDTILASKHAAITALSQQLASGSDFAQIAAASSEDEATKGRGGDLGWFSAERMPPEFMEQVANLPVGVTSTPIRSHLGFHIVRLLESRPAGDLPFDQARSEIVAELKNSRQAENVAAIAKSLAGVRYVRASP